MRVQPPAAYLQEQVDGMRAVSAVPRPARMCVRGRHPPATQRRVRQPVPPVSARAQERPPSSRHQLVNLIGSRQVSAEIANWLLEMYPGSTSFFPLPRATGSDGRSPPPTQNHDKWQKTVCRRPVAAVFRRVPRCR